MTHECKCSRPHHYSIHGNCLRCFGKAPAPRHVRQEQPVKRWTGSKPRRSIKDIKFAKTGK